MTRLATVRLTIGAAVLTGAMAGKVASPRAGDRAVERRTVVAELFTSEGCSSCPPADQLLQQIASASPVDGVEVIGLEEHVDYWDRLGWRDPFSSAALTNRQSEYASRVFHTTQIYTPQLVVDGAFETVGSDAAGARAAVAAAAARPGADLRVRASAGDRQVHVEIDAAVGSGVDRQGPADIVVALAEDGLTTHVERGENRGRTLIHSAVVRSLTSVGVLAPDTHARSVAVDLPLAAEWRVTRLRIVGFVQERKSRRILGVARARL